MHGMQRHTELATTVPKSTLPLRSWPPYVVRDSNLLITYYDDEDIQGLSWSASAMLPEITLHSPVSLAGILHIIAGPFALDNDNPALNKVINTALINHESTKLSRMVSACGWSTEQRSFVPPSSRNTLSQWVWCLRVDNPQ